MATGAEFNKSGELLASINLSMKILQAYHDKKKHREAREPILWEGGRLIWTR